MKTLTLEKYRRAGQTRKEVGGFVFVLQRPTQAEVYGRAERKVDAEFVAQHVADWQNVREIDLLPGGDPEPVAFDVALCAAWLADRADLWPELATALVESFTAYEEAPAALGRP